MNKKIVTSLGFTLLLLLNVLYIQKYIKHEKKFIELKVKYDIIKNQNSMLTKSCESSIVAKILNEGLIIESELFDKVQLNSHLLIRLNTKSCQMCIESILSSLEGLSPSYSDKILILGTFETKTQYKYYKQKHLKTYQVIDIEKEYLFDNYLEKNRIPYFFTIDKNKRISNLFIPDKNFPALTNTYLKTILPCIK
jgi:uncharacterized protein YsxB (DUF464 family)